MEQGLPILKQVREQLPEHQIIVSFFSPSGFEYFERKELCDAVIYLPLDKKSNAEKFAQILEPELAIFIKYDIWPNLLRSLRNRGSKLILAPALFRPEQIYFNSLLGGFFKETLLSFDKVVCQDQRSLDLLKSIGYNDAILGGDSRFDQALENTKQDFASSIPISFFHDSFCIILGSSWPPEEEISLNTLKENPEIKFIIAPHDISKSNIDRIQNMFQAFKPLKYSELPGNTSNSRLIIVDGIGQLKYLYRVADLAFIGGGFGKGLHSTIEPAIYRLPIIFGPNHHKFIEPGELISAGLAMEVQSKERFSRKYQELRSRALESGFQTKYQEFLKSKLGASNKIMKSILDLLRTDEK